MYYGIILDVRNEMLQRMLIQLWEYVEVYVLDRHVSRHVFQNPRFLRG